jgi:hypothetical protein
MTKPRPSIELMAFWLTMNKLMAENGLPELLWKDARHYWEIAQEQQAKDNLDRIHTIMNAWRKAA